MSTVTIPAHEKPQLQTQTTVGNYFVSNYPPFSFWKPERIGELEAALNRPPKPGTDLGIYTHIPFCRKRCHFCYFKVYTDKDSAAIRSYIEAVLSELRIYGGKRFIGGRKPSLVYFGGGTPSYLSVDQLRHLVREMQKVLAWDEVEEVTFEAEPGTLTDHKLKAIRELGVTRLSLGVENFDDHILEINGRAHVSKEIYRAYNYARSIEFPQINIDLIAGMVEETEANWNCNIEKRIELQPDSVTIYQMEIPFNTTIYKEMKDQGKLVAPVADWHVKRNWVKRAFAELEKAGYTVASAYTAVKDASRTKFVYRDSLWTGADLLALGVASFSHIGGTHFQNEKDFGPYIEMTQRGELPIHRALTMTEEERLIRQLVLQFKLGHLNRSFFQERFGVDICKRFAEPLGRLKQMGILEINDDEVRLSRDGLLQIDGL